MHPMKFNYLVIFKMKLFFTIKLENTLKTCKILYE